MSERTSAAPPPPEKCPLRWRQSPRKICAPRQIRSTGELAASCNEEDREHRESGADDESGRAPWRWTSCPAPLSHAEAIRPLEATHATDDSLPSEPSALHRKVDAKSHVRRVNLGAAAPACRKSGSLRGKGRMILCESGRGGAAGQGWTVVHWSASLQGVAPEPSPSERSPAPSPLAEFSPSD